MKINRVLFFTLLFIFQSQSSIIDTPEFKTYDFVNQRKSQEICEYLIDLFEACYWYLNENINLLDYHDVFFFRTIKVIYGLFEDKNLKNENIKQTLNEIIEISIKKIMAK